MKSRHLGSDINCPISEILTDVFLLGWFYQIKKWRRGRSQTLPGVKKYTQLTASLFNKNVDTPPSRCFCGKSELKRTSRLPIPQVEYPKKQILVIFVANLNKTKEIRLQRIHSFGDQPPATTFQGPQCAVRFGNGTAKHGERCGIFWGVLVTSAILWGEL